MTKSLKFICPSCNNQERSIEQVVVDAVYSHIITVEDNCIDYSNLEIYDGLVERHQCQTCGHIIKDSDGYPVDNEEDLIDWLKEQPYNKSQ